MALSKDAAGVPSFRTDEELDELLLEADQSGDFVTMTPKEWQRLRDDVEHDIELQRRAS